MRGRRIAGYIPEIERRLFLVFKGKRLTVQFSKGEDLKSWRLDHVLDKKEGQNSLQRLLTVDR